MYKRQGGLETVIIVLAEAQAGDDRLLQGGGSPHGEEVVDLFDALGDLLRGDGVPQPPAGNGIGLGQGGAGDGPLPHAGQGGKVDVPVGGIDDVLIYLVGDDIGIVLPGQVGDELQFLAGEDLAAGVGGVAQDQEMCIRDSLSSVNGLAETGELINIDGAGNRVASTLFGHKRVYFVVGANKIAPDYDAALWRARNIAAPKNAQRLKRKTPCAAKGDRCYDCSSPERICRELVVLWDKPMGVDTMEIVLIDQDLGM